MATLSIYKNIYQNTSTEVVVIETFLHAVQSGKWQDKVFTIRTIKDPAERKKAKEKLPYVTVSGRFTGTRNARDLTEHSGFLSMDIDNIASELEGVRELLKTDPYVYAVFMSVSGTGLCVIFKIDPEKHTEAFDGVADYLIKKYQIVIDPSGKDVCRPRYVSYDADLYLNTTSAVFKKYLPKPKKRKIASSIFVQSEFEEILNKMVEANVSCVEDYRDWVSVGFGLADQFGEAGRPYFHQLSSCSAKYEPSMCDRQYTHCLRGGGTTGKVTIATIYFFAKQAGISIMSATTAKIAAATSSGKAAGLDAKTIAGNLKKFEGIDDAEAVIAQAFAANQSFTQSESLVENIRMWLRHTYDLKRNLVTRKIENSGEIWTETDINTAFLDAKVIFPDISFELFKIILFSHNTREYNPLREFIESIAWDGEARIDQLGACINSNTGTVDWRCSMVRKWMIGVVASVYGCPNELNFILVGGKNTGKTKFFSMILPQELSHYFGRSQLNRGTDDEILMCEKLIILNDEYGGKNRSDERTEKRMMAAPGFSLRVPYGRGNEDVTRIASLCGTCNELDVLDDATGNRRIIVMESAGKFNYALYNSLDKYQLLAEALAAFRAGERPELTDEEITALEATTDGQYSKVVIEAELIQQHFLPPKETNPWDHMTATEIKVHLENHTRANLNINKIGAQLKKLGYVRTYQNRKYGYDIAPKSKFLPPA